MTLHLQRDSLASAVAWVARTLPSRPAQPILSGIRLQTREATLRLTAFDRETSSVVEIPSDAADEQVLIVPGRILADIVKALPSDDVVLRPEGSRVVIRSGKASFSLPTLPAEEYPELPEQPPEVGSIAGADLLGCVNQVAVAAGRDESLVMLTGIRVEIDGGTLTMAATDRYRLAVQEVAWQAADASLRTNLLVPARTLVDVARAFGSAGEIRIGLSGERGAEKVIGFTADGRRTTTRLLDAEFPKYRSLLPTESTAQAVTETQVLLDALRRVAIVAERNTPVRCSFTSGVLTLNAGSGEEATASEAIDCELTGDPIEIAFNPGFLVDGLVALGAPRVQMAFTEAHKPIVMTAVEGAGVYRYLLMPIRLTG